MTIRSAIIGGTGLGRHIEALPGKALFVPTEHGLVKGKVVVQDGIEIYLLGRHSAGHRIPPHQVPYLALARAMKALGVDKCFSSAAVGSLRRDWEAGEFVICDDFVDLSSRNITAFANSVEHRDFSTPFSARLTSLIRGVAREIGLTLRGPGIYANMNGPRYETPAEIEAVARLGGNLVGMTAGSEAIAMRELGVPYACVAVVTNGAAGVSQAPLSHLDVVGVMEERGKVLFNLLLESAKRQPNS
jgi:5'-methylthioadenosine phosphorylase